MIRSCLVTGVILFLAGCSQVIATQTPETATLSPSETGQVEKSVSPTQGNFTPMTPLLPTPAKSGLQSLIDKAKEDLAQRLSIPTTQINLVEAIEMDWSDSSLDCPQRGMVYLQVITPGYRILLGFSGNFYEYHSNRDTYVIYCENSISPNLPKP